MEDLIRKTCRIWEPKWQGVLIGRIHYWRLKRDKEINKSYELDTEIKENRMIWITCQKRSGDQIVEELKTMIFHSVKGGGKRKKSIPSKGVFWRKFLKEEIWKFSQRVGDHNFIHLDEQPIVQGFFILEQIIETFRQFNEYQVTFHSAIRADERIYLCVKEGKIFGYSKNGLHFTGMVGKRRNE